MSDSALSRALKKRYGATAEEPTAVKTVESGQPTASPSASGSALERALKKRYGTQAPSMIKVPQPMQQTNVEYFREDLSRVKNDGAKTRYDTYQQNVKRIAEIDKLLNGTLMKLDVAAGNRGDYDSLTAEKKKLEAANRVYERSNLHWDKTYVENAGADNYAVLSQNRDFGNPTKEQFYEFDTKAYGGYVGDYDGGKMQAVTGMFTETVSPEQAMEQMGINLTINDPLGFYMDNIGGSLPEGTTTQYSPKNDMAGKAATSVLAQGDKEQWSNLTDDEVGMYYYLLNTKGKSAAMEFLNGMARELQYRETEEYKEYMRTASAGDYILSNVASTVVKPVGDAVAFADEAISHIKGEEPNYHNAAHGLKNFTDSTRGMTAAAIDDATGASDSDFITWGDAYQGLMSGGDSLVGTMMLGKGYTIVAGMGAASSEAKRLYEAGASKEEVVAGGLMAGAAETFFEHFSVGYLVDDVLKKPTKSIAKKFLQVLGMGGVEASEEFATTFANYITDAAARGDTSDLKTMIEGYEKDGYTRGAAVFEAIKQVGGEALHSAAIGAISGTGMGTVGVIGNSNGTGESGETMNSEELDAWARSEGSSGGAMGAGGTMLSRNVNDTQIKAAEYDRAPKHQGIISLIRKVKTATHKDNESVSLGTVSDANAQKIRMITGIDVSGWAVEIEARQLAHIQKDHGENGAADHSMTNPDDVAKMGYILDSADEIAEGGFSTAYSNFINGKNRFAKTVLYQKDIGGRYYYVVEAVPDTKKKTLQIVSAYINQHKKIEGSHLIDAKSPDVTSKNVGVKPSKVNIAERNASVNYFSEQGSDGTPSVAGGDTSLGEGGYGAATAPMSEAQVVERASQLTAEGKRKATAADFDGILQELGEEEALKRLYNSQQFDRPTGMVEINGRRVNAEAYVDAYEQTLPDDPAALQEVIRRLEKEHTAEILKMEEKGTLNDYKAGSLKIDLQLFAARRKWDLLQLEPGEDGIKVRKFWEKRLKGNDEMHSEELLELMAGRTETYDPISNQKTLNKAKDKLMDPKYNAKLLRQLSRRSFQGRLTEVDVAAGIELTRKAYNEGNYEVMMDLIAGLSRRGTELGRAVQAFSMMARMTPEGVLKAAHRTLKAETDYVIGDGADDGLDVLADDLSDALNRLARLKESEIQSPRPESPNGEGAVEDAGVQVTENEGNGQRVTVQASREDVVGALADDLAATEGTYLTREDIQKQLEKVIKESTDVPEMVKRYVTKKLRKNDGGLAQRLYEMHQKGHLTSEATRRAMEQALELPTLTETDVKTLVEMAERVQELADDPVKQADAMEDIYDFLGAKMTVKFGDALQAWRKFAMLANVKTHVRNTVSNGAYAPIRKTNDLVSMGLERLLRVPAEQRGAYLGWQNTQHGQDILPAIRKNAELAVLEMQKRGAKYETGTGQLKQHRKFFGTGKVGEFFNKLSGFNSEWLEREDIWFFKPAYIDALGQLMTAREKTEITGELHELAMKRALDATFRADNAISDVLASLKKYQNETTAGKRLFGQAVDVVIPFSKTPANIAVQTVMHSPVGVVKGAFDLYNAVKGKGTKDAATAINTMAKGITGTALTVIGFLLGSAGLFNTGFGKTEKERAADELAGRQENAIIIGDTSITLDWLQPVAAPLIVGASIGQRMREDEISAASVFGAVMDGTDSLFELSMLQSLYDVLGGYDAGATATAASIGENVVSQSIPTLLGQAARSIDPVQRKTTGDSDFETIINQVIAKIPGLTYLLDPELDVWGNEVYRTGKLSGGGAALNVGQQFVLPSNTKTGTGAGDPISEEILRLYDEYGGEVIPTSFSRDDAKELGQDYVEANRDLGAVNRAAVEDFINDRWPYQVQETLPNGKTRNVTKFYSEMTDDERRRVLSRIYRKSKETVKGETDGTKSDQDRYFERLYEEMK